MRDVFPLLFASARRFLEAAVRHAVNRDAGEKTFALLHMSTALELLAKARISLEDPLLIAQGKVDPGRFVRGEFKSVSLERAFRTLESVTRFSLSSHQRAALSSLRASRNRFIHFLEPASQQEIQALVGAGLEIFFALHEAEFKDEEDPWEARSLPELAEDLAGFRDFVSRRMDALRSRLNDSVRPRTYHFSECQRCLQDAVVISVNCIMCLFCSHRIKIREAAELLSEDQSVEDCPACLRPSVAKHRLSNKAEPTYECFCCGYFRGPEPQWRDTEGNVLPRLRAF